MDEQELIQNPEMLLTLFQQSVERLIEQRPDTAAQEAQLHAVARAIEQLEKQQVPVPDSLRQTKMSLVAEIGQQAQFNRQLMTLGEGLTEVLEMIEGAVGKSRSEGKSQKETTPRQRRAKNNDSSITPISVIKSYIVKALIELGGSARTADVLKKMEKMLADQLTPRDLEYYKNGNPVWEHNARWERQHLVEAGILRKDSKHGYWELNQNHAFIIEETKSYTTI